MKKNALISIAMATYNGEKYLREQLDSIFHQTYENIEVVATDDCSTDSTVEILEEYSKKYHLRYYVNEKNLGFIKNFEKSISLCKGEYIALSDQDDIWMPEKIQILYNEIGDNLLIASDARLIDEKGNLIRDYFIEPVRIPKNQENYKYNLLFTNFIHGSSVFFRKELINLAIPFPADIYHDLWLGYCTASLDKLKYTNLKLTNYRIHQNNASGLKYKPAIIKLIELIFNEKTRAVYKKDCIRKICFTASILNRLKIDEKTKKFVQEVYWYNYYMLNFKFNRKCLNSLAFEWKNRNLLLKKPIHIIFYWFKRFVFFVYNH